VRFLTLLRRELGSGGPGGSNLLIRLAAPDARHLLGAVSAAGPVAGMATRGHFAAFSIFFWFQVTDFDFFLGFFSLCHFTFPFISDVGALIFESTQIGLAPGDCYVAALVLVADLVLAVAKALVAADGPAFGVFFRFQVTDLDRFLGFFSLCHFIFPSYLFGLFSRWLGSVTPKG
jgi:hypothetical protein